ncbi:hypothetical protein [Chitinimonas lacunae]|uniref:Uncharacterized protein n=1 Tax=Chitinimonas lacunae TaxID=1963018 RepID=A0ABV8MW83_9NEIS
MSDVNRYEGKPFLKFLEAYILWAIDELPEELSDQLVAMTPHLRRVYKCTGDWHSIVAQQMDFPDSLPALIREIWEKSKKTSKQEGWTLSPEAFSINFVNVNFPTED